MLNYRDARNYFQHHGGFTEKGTKTEWEIFLEDVGIQKEYSKRLILGWLGYI